jgi:hypothetical protein
VTFSSKGRGWETSQTCFAHGPTRRVFEWALAKRDATGAHTCHVEALREAPANLWRQYSVSL